MHDCEGLYIVPLNFGYLYNNGALTLYFHGAKEGRKINAIKNNPNIAFEADCEHKLIESDLACSYSFSYKSVIGSALAYVVENIEEKKLALSLIMKHQTGKEFSFDNNQVQRVLIFKAEVTNFSAKSYN